MEPFHFCYLQNGYHFFARRRLSEAFESLQLSIDFFLWVSTSEAALFSFISLGFV